MLFPDAAKQFWERSQRHQSVIYLLRKKWKPFQISVIPFKSLLYLFYFSFERHLVLPFNCILQKPLHFWKRRDNSNVQRFQFIFTIWIPPEKERGGKKKKWNQIWILQTKFIDNSLWYSKAHVSMAWKNSLLSQVKVPVNTEISSAWALDICETSASPCCLKKKKRRHIC